LCGGFLEGLKDYRFIYVWCGGCTLAGFVMCFFLYRHWKRLGGDEGYRPPGFEEDSTATTITSAH
jgi:hypothetical protein